MSLFSIPSSIGSSISSALALDLYKLALKVEAKMVKELLEGVMGAATATTSVTGGGWFAYAAGRLLPVEGMVVAPLLFAATIGAIFRQDLRRLGYIWCVGLPIALIGGYAMVNLTSAGLSVTDGLSSVIQAEVAPHLGADFISAVTLGVTPGTGGIGNLFDLVLLAGGLAIWLELAVRAAAIELAVFFMPLALAGLVWPATAHWAKRLVQILAALLLSKPVVVGALCLGDNAITSSQAGVSSMVTGAAILLMAAFAPMVLLKLVPMVDAPAIAHLQGLSRQPFYAAERSARRIVAAVGVASGVPAAAAFAKNPPPSDSANQLLGQVGQGGDGGRGGSEADQLGPAAFPPSAPPVAITSPSAGG